MTGAAASVSDAALLAGLPGQAFGFALLLARFGALLMVAPGLGEAQVPAMLRAALAAAIAMLLLPDLAPLMPPVPEDGMRAAAMVGAELLTGLWFGWTARLVAAALPAAAQIISYMAGLSNVLVPDLSGGAQVGAVSRLFGLAPPLLLLTSGLYAVPLRALVASYHLIPPGAVLPRGDAVLVVVRDSAAFMALAVRLAGPFLVAHTLWQTAIGVVGRVAPALHAHTLAMPAQVLGGLALLALTTPLLLACWIGAARAGLAPLTGG